MPKRAPAPHPDDPNARKKKNLDSDSPRGDYITTNREMIIMSVREKLLAGISLGFNETQNQQQQQNTAHDGRNNFRIATLQQYMDKGFRVNPRILRSLQASSQSQTMMFPDEEEEELWESESSQRREILTHHFCRRIDQR
jgi:hypothetical protein